MIHRTRPSALAMALSAALLLIIPAAALSQPAPDRAALEEKKRQQAEKRAMLEKLKKERTKENAQQREEREKLEAKVANQKLALEKAQEALQAAAKRRNSQGMELMHAAWMLDPQRMDYPFNTAAFAEATRKEEMEFFAYTAFASLAKRELDRIGAGDGGSYKQTILERMDKTDDRLETLRARITSGIVKLSTPKQPNCEIFLDGAFVGEGKGSIEVITGQHKVKTECLGHYDIEQFVNVRTGDANTIVLNPQPIPYYGYLVVNVKPADGVTIFLDDMPIDQRLGKTPDAKGTITGTGSRTDPFTLHARKWIIRFKKEGYDRWHRRITIDRDKVTMVNAALERLADQVEVTGND